LLVLPGIWVGVVLILEVLVPARIQLAPLLAAAPAIACAGTGRRSCVALAGLCAFVALLPWGPGNQPGGEIQRVGTFGAIVVVVAASYVASVRRQRTVGELAQVQAVAEVAQRVLQRPPRPAVGDVLVAARSASASAGASVGGDFYDIVDTPFGVRAIIGDVRGSGLGAVEVASVLLGSFREAAYDEPDLRDLTRRLELSLRRFLGDAEAAAARVPLADGARLWETGLLLVAPARIAADVREEFASVAVVSIRPDGWLEHVNCGHAPPLLVRCGEVSAVRGHSAGLPLGLSALAPGGTERARLVVTPFDGGDSLLLYTDGVTDAGGPDVGPLPLAEILADLADAEPDYVLSAIEAEVTQRARRGRARDLAMLLVHRP
jgi:hypothetical protein